MHGQERRELAPGTERPRRPCRTGVAGEGRELAVGHDLPARDVAQRLRAFAVEPVVDPQGHVPEVVGRAGEEPRQPSRKDMSYLRGRTCPFRTRELAVEDAALVVKPHLAHAPAGCVVLHERRLHPSML